MERVLEITLAVTSGVFYIALLWRAFFTPRLVTEGNWFKRADVIVAFCISAIFAWLAIDLFDAPPRKIDENAIIGGMIAQLILGGIVVSYVALRRISLRAFFGTAALPVRKSIGLGILLTVAISPFVGTLAQLLNRDPSQEQTVVQFFRDTPSVESRLLLAFMAVIVAPIIEEVVFRGLLYRIFKGYFGTMSAMFFTSVLFAVIHGNLPSLLPLTLLAFAFTAALERSGSLLVSIAMHGTFNALTLSFLLWGKTP